MEIHPHPATGYPLALRTFHDVSELAPWVIGAGCLMALGRVAVTATDPTEGRSFGHDLAVGISVPLDLLAWILTSLWLYRTHANADQLVPAAGRRSGIWAWLGWIVPIVWFWYPMQVVEESWAATASALPLQSPLRRVPEVTTWWRLWIAFLVGCVWSGTIIGRLLGWLLPDGEVPIAATIVVAGLAVAALLLWIRIVRGITAVQSELIRTAASAPSAAR